MTSTRYPGSLFGSRPKARKAPANALSTVPIVPQWTLTAAELAARDRRVADAATRAADASWVAYLPVRDKAVADMVMPIAVQAGADRAVEELRRTGRLVLPRKGRLLGSTETTVHELVDEVQL